MPPVPVLVGAVVALLQLVGGVRGAGRRVGGGVVAATKLQRVHLQLHRQLVDQALQAERPLDESGGAERCHRWGVELGAVLDGLHVRAGVQALHRSSRRRHPAVVPTEAGDVLADERDERAIALGADREALDGGVAVAGGEVFLPPGEGAADGPAGTAGQFGRDERVVAGIVLGAEAAAHVFADHPHLVGRHAEVASDPLAYAPDVLGRGVDDERVALPRAHRLVGLEGVVQHRLRAVFGLDHHVGLGQRGLDVAAGVAAGVLDEFATAYGVVRVEHRLQDFPVDLDQTKGGLGLARRCLRRWRPPALRGVLRPPRPPGRHPARSRRGRRAPEERGRDRCSGRARGRTENAGRQRAACRTGVRRRCRSPRRGRGPAPTCVGPADQRCHADLPATGRGSPRRRPTRSSRTVLRLPSRS